MKYIKNESNKKSYVKFIPYQTCDVFKLYLPVGYFTEVNLEFKLLQFKI